VDLAGIRKAKWTESPPFGGYLAPLCGDGSVVAYFPMWSFKPVTALQAAKEGLARGVLRTMCSALRLGEGTHH
jgi:hypothetical protein